MVNQADGDEEEKTEGGAEEVFRRTALQRGEQADEGQPVEKREPDGRERRRKEENARIDEKGCVLAAAEQGQEADALRQDGQHQQAQQEVPGQHRPHREGRRNVREHREAPRGRRQTAEGGIARLDQADLAQGSGEPEENGRGKGKARLRQPDASGARAAAEHREHAGLFFISVEPGEREDHEEHAHQAAQPLRVLRVAVHQRRVGNGIDELQGFAALEGAVHPLQQQGQPLDRLGGGGASVVLRSLFELRPQRGPGLFTDRALILDLVHSGGRIIQTGVHRRRLLKGKGPDGEGDQHQRSPLLPQQLVELEAEEVKTAGDALRQTLQKKELPTLIPGGASELLSDIALNIQPPQAALDLLCAAIAEEPAALIRDGGVIAKGFDAELDELRAISENSEDFLIAMEIREKERTGITRLRVQYNRVHGFYIEVPQSQASMVPAQWQRRQTLKLVEYGAFPSFLVTAEEVQKLINTNSSDVFTAQWAVIGETAAETDAQIRSLWEEIGGRRMTDHTLLAPQTARVQYGDDLAIVVNYGDKPYPYGGTEVPPLGYVILKGGDAP